jgi:hypothetical protein
LLHREEEGTKFIKNFTDEYIEQRRGNGKDANIIIAVCLDRYKFRLFSQFCTRWKDARKEVRFTPSHKGMY